MSSSRTSGLLNRLLAAAFLAATIAACSEPTGPGHSDIPSARAAWLDAPINDYDLTIESIWQQILDARDRGELNSVRFDHRGIPMEVNIGPWASDGGYAYHVRRFQPLVSLGL